jgi:hypothetical protein
MTQEDRDAEIGRVVREKKGAEHELEILRARAQRIGELMRSFGNMLVSRPENIQFGNISTPGSYMKSSDPIFNSTEFSGDSLVQMVTQIREQADKVRALKEQATRLGI